MARRILTTIPVLFCLLFLAATARAQQVTISVLATTDMHGNLLPIDYFTDRPAARGLAKMATLNPARAGGESE